MDKEKVTEELVRQNGNQAAAVMADYAGQSGGGNASKGVVLGTFVDFYRLPCLKSEKDWPEPVFGATLKLSDILADGYSLVQYRKDSARQTFYGFYIVKVTGESPSVSLNNKGVPVFTDCEPIKLDIPDTILDYLILSTFSVDFSGPEAVFVDSAVEERVNIHQATSLSEVTFTCNAYYGEDDIAVQALCAHCTITNPG